jgi:hypothetical protein
MEEGDPQVQSVLRELQRRVDAGNSRAKVLQILVAQYESGKRSTFPIRKRLDEFTVAVLAMVAKRYGVRAIRVETTDCDSQRTMRAFMSTLAAMRGQIASVELSRNQIGVLEALGRRENPTLTEIKIHDAPRSMSSLVRLLSRFPNLQSLSLDCSRRGGPLEDAEWLGTVLLPRMPNLKILGLEGATLTPAALIAIGDGARRCPSLRDLTLRGSRGYDLNATRIFLTLVAQSRVLNLGLTDSAPWETHGRALGRFMDALQDPRRAERMPPPPPRVPALDDMDGDPDFGEDSQFDEIKREFLAL